MSEENTSGAEDKPAAPDHEVIAGLTSETLWEIGTNVQDCEDRKLKTEAQRYVAVTCRQQGYSYPMIAEMIGRSLSWTWELVQGAMRRVIKEPVETIRQIQIDRLDQLLAGVWERATAGDTFSIASALQIMARIDALHGIEAPKQVHHTHTEDAVAESRNALAKALAAAHGSGATGQDIGDAAPEVD